MPIMDGVESVRLYRMEEERYYSRLEGKNVSMNITSSTADAAYLSSIFWIAMTIGRMIAVVIAIYVPANVMIKVLLGMAVCSTFLGITIMTISYAVTAVVCASLGFAMSALFPLMITIMVDYGFKM